MSSHAIFCVFKKCYKEVFYVARLLDRFVTRISKFRCHLSFNLACKSEKKFPMSLTIKTKSRGKRGLDIASRSSYIFLVARIGDCHDEINYCKKKIGELNAELDGIVSSRHRKGLNDFLLHRERTVSDSLRRQHLKK